MAAERPRSQTHPNDAPNEADARLIKEIETLRASALTDSADNSWQVAELLDRHALPASALDRRPQTCRAFALDVLARLLAQPAGALPLANAAQLDTVAKS